ncbi:hypothetical protein EGM51_09925 [Verrucomicrobia bacterium S94]|nr:hypothetical protein EGM51_09925 [Verrucomicrobia bacterium S94]
MKSILIIIASVTLFGCSQNKHETKGTPFSAFNERKIKKRITKELNYLGIPRNIEGEIEYPEQVLMAFTRYYDLPFIKSATHATYIRKLENKYECLYFINTNDHWEVIILNPISKCPDRLSNFEKVADYVYYKELEGKEIIGKWSYVEDEDQYIEFLPDGTVSKGTGEIEAYGFDVTWTIQNKDTLQLHVLHDGELSMESCTILIIGDELTMTSPKGLVVKCRRFK